MRVYGTGSASGPIYPYLKGWPADVDAVVGAAWVSAGLATATMPADADAAALARQDLLPLTGSIADDTELDTQAHTRFAYTVTDTKTLTTTADAVGGVVYSLVLTADGSERVITFGTGFVASAGTVTLAAGDACALLFVGCAGNLYEVARTNDLEP